MKNDPTQTLLLCVAVFSLYTLIQIVNLSVYQPDVRLMALAIRATIEAQPTPTPIIVQIPVEIPVTVEVTRMVTAPQPTELPQTEATTQTKNERAPSATQTPVPIEIKPTSASVGAKTVTDLVAVAPTLAMPMKSDDVVAAAQDRQAAAITCPTTSSHVYTLIPMEVADTSRPDSQHGDLNLAIRGYEPIAGLKEYVTYGGEVDADAPQLTGLFSGQRQAAMTSTYQVLDWRWDCGKAGCAGDPLTHYNVTLLGVATTAGEPILPPYRRPELHSGGFTAVVLYAEATRLTLAYTRDGTVAHGYTVHLENLCVDPTLLARYREGNAGGRRELPGLHNEEAVGVAASDELLVAIRDRGMFMDPRSKDDWWH